MRVAYYFVLVPKTLLDVILNFSKVKTGIGKNRFRNQSPNLVKYEIAYELNQR